MWCLDDLIAATDRVSKTFKSIWCKVNQWDMLHVEFLLYDAYTPLKGSSMNNLFAP